ncbi:uncharacterized protein VP01_1089g4 [Puccinia sorghi]|uniref:Uncharacterized protein n=1 Tax=Puccinia sorghi TaxID=27349 RepID=A0A0L6VUI7_9BASI|nr:uncharacterized protein VP01_1089g4 [Puccinia sorghi]
MLQPISHPNSTLNGLAMPMIETISRKTMATHTSRVYLWFQEKVKVKLLVKQELISFTQDAWTAPNMTALLTVTAHFINESNELQNLTATNASILGRTLPICSVKYSIVITSSTIRGRILERPGYPEAHRRRGAAMNFGDEKSK